VKWNRAPRRSSAGSTRSNFPAETPPESKIKSAFAASASASSSEVRIRRRGQNPRLAAFAAPAPPAWALNSESAQGRASHPLQPAHRRWSEWQPRRTKTSSTAYPHSAGYCNLSRSQAAPRWNQQIAPCAPELLRDTFSLRKAFAEQKPDLAPYQLYMLDHGDSVGAGRNGSARHNLPDRFGWPRTRASSRMPRCAG